jgi:hypothetical protein
MLTKQALTNQTLGHGDTRMDAIDEHLRATDGQVVSLQTGHAELKSGHNVLHAKVRSITASRRDPRAFWTAVGTAVGTGGLAVWEVIKAAHEAAAAVAPGIHP